jgi:hypothetical protein
LSQYRKLNVLAGESHDAYQQVYDNQGDNQASLGHELIAGAASFAAFKTFEDHQRKEGKSECSHAHRRKPAGTILTCDKGKQVNHQFAKEVLAGFAGAEVDRLAETKGEDFIDRERAKHDAKRNAEHMYDEHYGQYDQYDPNQAPPQRLQDQFGQNSFGGNNY